MKIEFFPIVTPTGETIGKASRETCHNGSFLLHPVVHLHIINASGELYLQKRASNKDIQPGKWDTAVGGHVDYGETITEALKREVREELNIMRFYPIFMHRYQFRSAVELELVSSYYTVYDGLITPNKNEIADGRFWRFKEIDFFLGKNIFTPNFEHEFRLLTENSKIPLNKTR